VCCDDRSMTTPPGSSDGLDPVAGTARWTAAERARESARPDRLFDDPLAMVLAGQAGQALAEAMRGDGTFDNPALAIRTRFFDDVITDAVTARGMRQVVLVAAGMDTRAYRLPVPQDLAWSSTAPSSSSSKTASLPPPAPRRAVRAARSGSTWPATGPQP